MTAHLRYLHYVLRHKWSVLCAGLPLGVPLWRLIVHDWTKFLPVEWFPYVHHFYGPKPAAFTGMHKPGRDEPFDRAWNHHQKANPHHWQYWLLKEDDGDRLALAMPDADLREMVADWRGAGLAQGKTEPYELRDWYIKNAARIVLHPDTRRTVEVLIAQIAQEGA